MIFFITCLVAIGMISPITTFTLLIAKQRYINKMKSSCEFLIERNERIASGWIPPAYQNLQTDDERNAAIDELLRM